MDEFFTQVISSFGVLGLIIVAIFAGVVWILAHASAEQGTSVSVLWGLVAYTKSSKASKIEAHASKPVVSAEPEMLPPRPHQQDVSETQDYQKGKSLELVVEPGDPRFGRNGYAVFSKAWGKGVLDALEGYTSLQKSEEINKLVDTHFCKLTGEIIDLDNLSLKLTTKDGLAIVMTDNWEESAANTLEILHIGDRVEVIAKISPSPNGLSNAIFNGAVAIKRIVKSG